jgi:prolipoprotein diacylglyceryl transferase
LVITQRQTAWATGLRLIRDFHNHVVLFRAGDWIFVTYGLVAGTAFFAGFSAGLWYDAMAGQDVSSKAQSYLFFVLPAVLIGARAFSVLLEWRMLFRSLWTTLLKPGYMLHGGITGGLVAFVLWSLVSGKSLPLLLDAAAFAMPLGEAICRLGCHVYGCCWGKPTRHWAGIIYNSPDAKVVRQAPELRGVKIHPVQLYGMTAHLIQFAAFYSLLPYKLFDGMLAVLYCLTHPLIRFMLERLRQDDRGKLFGPFTHTHLYSSIQFALGAAAWSFWRTTGTNTVLNTNLGWLDSIADPATLGCLLLLTLIIVLSFGVHYGSVGSWLPQSRKWMSASVITVRKRVVTGTPMK